MRPTESKAKEALRRIEWVMNRLGLSLHPEKTRVGNLTRGQEGFEFMGCTIHKRRSIQRKPWCHLMPRGRRPGR